MKTEEKQKSSGFVITRDQQLKELARRVPPVLNVNVVVYEGGKYLIGKRNPINKPKTKSL